MENNAELIAQCEVKAKQWLSPSFDEETRQSVQQMLDKADKTDLIEVFYKNLEFGTGGLRGIMGAGTNRMNVYTVGMATQGFANYLKKNFADRKEISVVVCHDCRNNSRKFAESVADVFSANGIKVYLFDDMRPTPECSFAIRHLGCQAGVNITASHNPKEYNGYKAYWEDGAQVLALGLYNSRIVKLINKKGMLKSSVIIDELPTIYFKGLDNLIATARSNKVAVCLGFQDFSQLVRDYGDKEAKVVMNTVGNIFSGQVVGETAKTLSERFGKVLQKRQSISINRQDVSTSINTQMDSLIPPSKISGLTQGMFVGAVSDNFDERIEQKIFHAEIVVDNAKVAAETKAYKPIPVITDFTDEHGNDCMKEKVQENYNRIKDEVKQIVKDELERIASDESLKHLLQNK